MKGTYQCVACAVFYCLCFLDFNSCQKDGYLDLIHLDASNATHLKFLEDWYCNITTMKDLEDDVLAQNKLNSEASSRGIGWIFQNASMSASKCVDRKKLTRAECIAVIMFTHNDFYKDHNYQMRSGNWRLYRIHTALSYRAIKKLSQAKPIPIGKLLYRGMGSTPFKDPAAKSLYFKQIASFSTKENVAKNIFGPVVFKLQVTTKIVAASIDDISLYEELEVLISPFEAVDFVKKGVMGMEFKTSLNQPVSKFRC